MKKSTKIAKKEKVKQPKPAKSVKAVKSPKPAKAVKTMKQPKSKNQAEKRGTGAVRTVPAKQVKSVSVKENTQVALTEKTFAGAKRIEITDTEILVTHGAIRRQDGVEESVELRRRLPQTSETAAAANAAIKKGKMKKVRIDFE